MPFKLTIKKTPHEKEWVARVTKDGKLIAGPYFAGDKADAQATGQLMLKRAQSTAASVVTYALTCKPEDIPVGGNALASGDDATDKAAEDEILADLDSGNPWAWCYVEVIATITVGEHTFVGRDGLGCCSYKSEEDFKASRNWPEMQQMALADLKRTLNEAIFRGDVAAVALDALN